MSLPHSTVLVDDPKSRTHIRVMCHKLLEPSRLPNQSLADNPSPLRCGGGSRNIRLPSSGMDDERAHIYIGADRSPGRTPDSTSHKLRGPIKNIGMSDASRPRKLRGVLREYSRLIATIMIYLLAAQLASTS
jgi:hypothetical protein